MIKVHPELSEAPYLTRKLTSFSKNQIVPQMKNPIARCILTCTRKSFFETRMWHSNGFVLRNPVLQDFILAAMRYYYLYNHRRTRPKEAPLVHYAPPPITSFGVDQAPNQLI